MRVTIIPYPAQLTGVRRVTWCLVVVLLFSLGAPMTRGWPGVSAATALDPLVLKGSGSTFVFPFFRAIFPLYTQTHPDVQVQYFAVGSGRGIADFTNGLMSFGASDVPMNAQELRVAERGHGPVVQVPVIVGAEAIVYNIPGIAHGVRLTAADLVGIFQGTITFWDDPDIIAQQQDHLQLPHRPISVVYRSDSSGTTYIFTDYLSTVSASWRRAIGAGKLTGWPVGEGGLGNGGVATLVHDIPGAIGYVELAYATSHHMAIARIQNRAGVFVTPSTASTQAAVAQGPRVSASQFSIVNAPGAQSYPIVGYSWVVLYQHSGSATERAALSTLFQWVVVSAQRYAISLGYVPLPTPVQRMAAQSLTTIRAFN